MSATGLSLRLAELMAALSLAEDTAMGQPLEQGLRVCSLAVRFGERVGLEDDELRRVFYVSLLRHIGCTAESHAFDQLVHDELAYREHSVGVDFGRPTEVLRYTLQHLRRANSTPRAAVLLGRMLLSMRVLEEGSRAVCEVAQMMADRLGFDEQVRNDVGALSERWDGKGLPLRLKGEEIPLPVRVVQVAEAGQVGVELGGADAALAVVRERAGGAYDPALSAQFIALASELLVESETGSTWEETLALEPGPAPMVVNGDVDAALRAMGEFADLKSPFTVGHSSGVAELAARAGERAGLPAADVAALRRAGYVHDLGRVGVSSRIWEKPGPLSHDERERVRLHPYHGERVLARPDELLALGRVAALHHERLDGSGYHRGSAAAHLSFPARVLAAADAYHAMTEPRPHRGAFGPEAAAQELRAEVRAGRLDADAADAVLGAAGHGVRRRRDLPGGLTAREVEVLRLLARGLSTRQVAERLVVAPKTADAHVQHIYTKIGVSSRAAAALWAMQHDLVGTHEKIG